VSFDVPAAMDYALIVHRRALEPESTAALI